MTKDRVEAAIREYENDCNRRMRYKRRAQGLCSYCGIRPLSKPKPRCPTCGHARRGSTWHCDECKPKVRKRRPSDIPG
jgi:hypothetical protein